MVILNYNTFVNTVRGKFVDSMCDMALDAKITTHQPNFYASLGQIDT